MILQSTCLYWHGGDISKENIKRYKDDINDIKKDVWDYVMTENN